MYPRWIFRERSPELPFCLGGGTIELVGRQGMWDDRDVGVGKKVVDRVVESVTAWWLQGGYQVSRHLSTLDYLLRRSHERHQKTTKVSRMLLAIHTCQAFSVPDSAPGNITDRLYSTSIMT